MDPYVYWFLLALVLVILEMATNTFYLLVVAAALAIGGGAALVSPDQTIPFTLSAVAGVVGTVILRMRRRKLPNAAPDQSLDIGQPVHSVVWNEDGSARAVYRGTEWDAEAESAERPRDGVFYIKAMRGSTLILSHEKPKS